MATEASLVVAASKAVVHKHLNLEIVRAWREATKTKASFTIALSGGSLPSFLSSLSDAFIKEGEDPKFDSWHVLLADERCVPATDPDSNLGSLKEKFLQHVPIPPNQIYGIDESKLDSAEAVASDYESTLRKVLETKSQGKLDLAVLGFGPDGHTCSLFPGHDLLQETKKWVASIEDSPKPPPKRITLTLPVLNQQTRHVIFCGAGGSKSPILQKVFAEIREDTSRSGDADGKHYAATMSVPPPFPCAMVAPMVNDGGKLPVTWVVDADAMDGVAIA